MKDRFIADLETNDEFMGYFMIKQIAIKMGSNRKAYLDLLLGDRTGEISAKKWDVSDEEHETLNKYKAGDLIKVAAKVTEWNSMKQLRVSRIRMANPDDPWEYSDFIKTAPQQPEEMLAYIRQQAEQIEDMELRELCLLNLNINEEKLMYYPAASKNHHAERSGLLWHIKRMLMSGIALCDVYTNLNKDLLVCGVILHDIEKLNELWGHGYTRAEPVNMRFNGLKGFTKYISKRINGRNGRKLRCGHSKGNLTEPEVRESDRRISRTRLAKIARDVMADGKEILEKLYPEYRLEEVPVVRYSDFVAGAYIYARMRRRS
jgi:hypothetical protein